MWCLTFAYLSVFWFAGRIDTKLQADLAEIVKERLDFTQLRSVFLVQSVIVYSQVKEVRCEALDVRIHFWLGENTTQVIMSPFAEFAFISLFLLNKEDYVFTSLSVCWLLSVRLHTTGWAKKTSHFTFVHIFANYWSIFKILSLAHSADNLR